MANLLKAISSLSLSVAVCGAALAADYPTHPVTIVVSTSPGGGADTTMRLLAPRLAQHLGQSVIVENKPGASGMIAGGYVARSAPDGYTLLMDITTFAVNPALHKKMQYRPLKDLTPITEIVRSANVLVVNPKVPVKTLGEFIKYAKQQDGRLSYASSGIGSSQHLAMEMFKHEVHIQLTHVPYKGGGPAMSDLLAGHVQSYFAFIPTAADHIKQGRLRPLATTGERRSALLPDVPTIAESGFPGFQSYDWNGLFAPAGTPPAVVERISHAVKAVLEEPQIQARLKDLGLELVGSTPADFRNFLVEQIKQSKDTVKKSNITLE